MRLAVAHRLDQLVDDVRRGRAVGIAHAQVDDVLARRACRRLHPVDLGEDVGRRRRMRWNSGSFMGAVHRGAVRPVPAVGALPSTICRARESDWPRVGRSGGRVAGQIDPHLVAAAFHAQASADPPWHPGAPGSPPPLAPARGRARSRRPAPTILRPASAALAACTARASCASASPGWHSHCRPRMAPAPGARLPAALPGRRFWPRRSTGVVDDPARPPRTLVAGLRVDSTPARRPVGGGRRVIGGRESDSLGKRPGPPRVRAPRGPADA